MRLLFLLATILPLCAQSTSDGTPPGMIAFYMPPNSLSATCPAGWSVPLDANKPQQPIQGRLILSLGNTPQYFGATVNKPMADQTPPVHTHSYLKTLAPSKKTVTGWACCYSNGAHASTVVANGIAGASSMNVPLLQLPLCVRNATTPEPAK
jgi:hypothetical protein